MSKIFTNSFKTYAIDQLISSNPRFFMYLGRHQPFVDDNNPPIPQDDEAETFTGAYDTMIVAKSIRTSDMAHMIPRFDWAQGTGYIAYRDNAGTQYGKPFYVTVSSATGYDVFKCLSNNNTLSTSAPNINATSPTDDIYETSDGYQWKYMYSIPTATFTKFATSDYIPVYANNAVVAGAVDGAIDYINIEYPGSNYDSFTNGTIQTINVSGNSQQFVIESTASSNNSFYVGSAMKITQGTGAGQLRTIIDYRVSGSTRTVVVDTPFDITPSTSSTYEITPLVIVTGGGTNFHARALVNAASSNSIYKVEIINRGSGYYYGTATVAGNTGGVANSAALTVIISPKGGHGYDPIRELGGKYLCITTTFDSTEASANTKMLDTQEFRAVGILSAPQFANVEITYTSATGIFTIGDTITQSTTGVTGVITKDTGSVLTLTKVTGDFYTGNLSSYYVVGTIGVTPTTAAVANVRNNGATVLNGTDGHPHTDYVNGTTRATLTLSTGSFSPDEVVTLSGNVATSNAIVYFANSSTMWLTSVKGVTGNTITSITTGATATFSALTPPDLLYGTGDILYTENISPINKAAGQTETIKAIIEF